MLFTNESKKFCAIVCINFIKKLDNFTSLNSFRCFLERQSLQNVSIADSGAINYTLHCPVRNAHLQIDNALIHHCFHYVQNYFFDIVDSSVNNNDCYANN